MNDTAISAFIGMITGVMERPTMRQHIPGWLPMVMGTVAAIGSFFAEDGSKPEAILNSLVQASSNWLGEWGFEGPEKAPGTQDTTQAASLKAVQEQLADLNRKLDQLRTPGT